jgi:hypothetical protein
LISGRSVAGAPGLGVTVSRMLATPIAWSTNMQSITR